MGMVFCVVHFLWAVMMQFQAQTLCLSPIGRTQSFLVDLLGFQNILLTRSSKKGFVRVHLLEAGRASV